MTLWQHIEICLNPGFLLEPRKNFLQMLHGDLMQKSYLLGPMTWKVTQRNVWKHIANLRIKRLNKDTKSQHHAWMTINFKNKKMVQLENYLLFTHKLFSNVCILLVFGDPMFCDLWTNLHDQWPKHVTNVYLVWSPTFIIQVNADNIVMWQKLQKQCRLGLFQDSDFAGHFGDSKSTSGGVLCIFGSHTFVLISWMCNKQTSASERHSNKHGSHSIKNNEFWF